MMAAGIAIAVMVVATTAVHMGLPEAIARVVVKVARCHKCLTFWTTLVVLELMGSPLIISLPLSLIAAYLSGWFGMVLTAVNKIYERLWERLNRKK